MDDFDFEGRKPGRPKTGRKPMLRASVDEDLIRRAQAYADRHFVSFAEAVEVIMEKGLARAESEDQS